MKECDNNSTRKIHISSSFIWSISLLIMFDFLLLRPSLHCNTPLHFTTLHPTTLRYTSPHITTLRYTSPNYTSPHVTTLLHFTQLHFATLHHVITLRYTSPHVTTPIDTSRPLIYTSLPSHLALPIYISYRSISPHLTSLN
jgi:hypothetical protein